MSASRPESTIRLSTRTAAAQLLESASRPEFTTRLRLIEHAKSDAAWSLALDDALLHNGGYYLSTRTNDPCVSLGFNQNVESEVDVALAEANGIPVIRRKTGGGAVYRDRGCIAFSFVVPREMRNDIIDIVVKALRSLEIDTVRSGRNDLFWNGRKISGIAWSGYEERLLLHGSLLFSTDVSMMSRLLDCGKTKYSGTSISSVRSRVANLKDLFPDMDAKSFRLLVQDRIVQEIASLGFDIREEPLPADLVAQADRCAEEYRL